MNMEQPGCCRVKLREEAEKTALIHRLSRIEGQIRGLRGMVEKDAYCPDILTQVSAATAALNGFARSLMKEHIRTCVAEDLREGKEDAIQELMETVGKFMR